MARYTIEVKTHGRVIFSGETPDLMVMSNESRMEWLGKLNQYAKPKGARITSAILDQCKAGIHSNCYLVRGQADSSIQVCRCECHDRIGL